MPAILVVVGWAAALATAGAIVNLIGGGPTDEERIAKELTEGKISPETQAKIDALTPERRAAVYATVEEAAVDSAKNGPATTPQSQAGGFDDAYLAQIRSQFGLEGGSSRDPKIHIGLDPAVAPPTGTGPGLTRPGAFPTQPRYGTADDALETLFEMGDQELREFQEHLYDAGFYGSTPRSEVRWGVVGPETVSAAQTFFTTSARTADEDGSPRPWRGILDELAESRRQGFEQATGEIKPRTLQIPDRQEVANKVIDLFSEVLGRPPTQAELDRYTDKFLSTERERQTQLAGVEVAQRRRELGRTQGLPDEQLPAVPGEVSDLNPVQRAIAEIRSEFGAEIAVNEQVSESERARQLVGQTAVSAAQLTGGR